MPAFPHRPPSAPLATAAVLAPAAALAPEISGYLTMKAGS
jgi:hypothetical protein